MLTVLHQIDKDPNELVHKVQTNYYNTMLASCNDTGGIKIYKLNGKQCKLQAELKGHDGPVWQIDWSHPEFDNLLASCSYDRKVIIWKENNGNWEKIKEHKDHNSSVNSVQWAPREFGLILACASADGSISVLRHNGYDDWESRKISNAHNIGVNAISWAPPLSSVSTMFRPTGDTSSMLNRPALVKRFVSCGCDHLVKIWKYVEESDNWIEERQLDLHTDWVRDVAWAPSIFLPKQYIASCSQDNKVIIWSCIEGLNGTQEWESQVLDFEDIVWDVAWSEVGATLAVSVGKNQVSLWKEDRNGDFQSFANEKPVR